MASYKDYTRVASPLIDFALLGIVFDTYDGEGISQRVGWVSFSIPVMVMDFPKAVLGIVFDTHDGHTKLFGGVWGNLRALGIVFDTYV